MTRNSEKPDIVFYLNSAASNIVETTPNPGFEAKFVTQNLYQLEE